MREAENDGFVFGGLGTNFIIKYNKFESEKNKINVALNLHGIANSPNFIVKLLISFQIHKFIKINSHLDISKMILEQLTAKNLTRIAKLNTILCK